MVRLLARSAFFVALACSFAASRAQDSVQNQPLPVLKLTTRLVVLDVVVTDSKGETVPGLTREDFTLLEAGKPKPIRNFDAWRAPAAPELPAAVDPLGRPDWGSGALTVFVLDDLNTPFDEKAYCAFTLKRFLTKQPATLAAPSMLLIVNENGVQPLQELTRSRDALIAAIDRRPKSNPRPSSQLNSTGLLAESFAALNEIDLSLSGYRQHKNLIWLGRGFPSLDMTTLEAGVKAKLTAAIQRTESELQDARITVYKVDPITADAMSAPTDLNTAIAVSGSVEGNASLTAPSEDPLESNFNFNAFAKATGGSYFYGRNDLDREIGQSLQRGREFYTLTYVPAAGEQSYRRIDIKLRNPSLHATTREGFYAAPAVPATLPAALSPDLELAARSRLVYTGVALQIAAASRAPDGASATVKFVVEDRSLTWKPQSSGPAFEAKLRLVLIALDAAHRVQHTGASSLTPTAASAQEIGNGLLRTGQTVAIDPRTRFLRLLVEDASGHVGSAEVDLPASPR